MTDAEFDQGWPAEAILKLSLPSVLSDASRLRPPSSLIVTSILSLSRLPAACGF